MDRIKRNDLFMKVAWLFAQRSTCNRGRVGTVAVIDNRIISTGYNGAPSGHSHCSKENGCDPEKGSCTNAIHAEANLISFAAKAGVSLNNSILYCTHSPCYKCAQLIIQAGVKHVYYNVPYHDDSGIELLHRSSILVHNHTI